MWVKADVLMTHDVCGPGTIGIFKKEFGQNANVRSIIVTVDEPFLAPSKAWILYSFQRRYCFWSRGLLVDLHE